MQNTEHMTVEGHIGGKVLGFKNWDLSAAGHYTLAKEPRCILSHAHGNDDDHILSKLYHACCCPGLDKRLSATGCVCMSWKDLEPSHYLQTGHKGGCGAFGLIGLNSTGLTVQPWSQYQSMKKSSSI